MDALRARAIAMHEVEFSPSQPLGAAAEPIAAAARRLCPYCSSVEIAPSHRRGPIEKYLLRAIHARVYRCADCNSRFYGFSHSEAVVPPKKHAA
jgi:DNA-directed RNA polymerase subunit RPC12/RpoP